MEESSKAKMAVVHVGICRLIIATGPRYCETNSKFHSCIFLSRKLSDPNLDCLLLDPTAQDTFLRLKAPSHVCLAPTAP
jgi:hypothetical protein